MPKKYCLAILVLISTGISVAEADQKDNQAIVIGRAGADQATASASTVLTDQPMFKFGGFGSLGVSHSSQNLGDYVLDSAMPKGAGLSSAWPISNNSRIAAHLNANFTPKVSALLQIDSEYHADGTYRPEVEWFSVKYAFTPNFYMRVGRVVLPTFMDSENRDVGYSYTWVNPPVELYHQLSIPSSDGVDAMYRFEIGEAGNTIKAIFGRNKFERPTSLTTSKDMWGIFDTLEYGQAIFHLGYQQRMSSTQSSLTGVTGAWVQNSDLSVGASYDPGDWFIMSEWIQRRSTYKTGAMYVSAGYRINKFTPYLIHSQNSRGSFLQDSPPPTAFVLQLANRSQSTNSMGLRWDFMRNFDFKIQYDRVTLSDNSNGYLINVPANITLYGTTFYVISAVVDFVF
jgi:opacity protein-like surface antigen